MSLSTQIVGDDKNNWYNVEEISEMEIARIIGNDFASITFKRNERVQPFATITSNIRLEGKAEPINYLSFLENKQRENFLGI